MRVPGLFQKSPGASHAAARERLQILQATWYVSGRLKIRIIFEHCRQFLELSSARWHTSKAEIPSPVASSVTLMASHGGADPRLRHIDNARLALPPLISPGVNERKVGGPYP